MSTSLGYGAGPADSLTKLTIVTNLPDPLVNLESWDPQRAVTAPWEHSNHFQEISRGDQPALLIGATREQVKLLGSLLDNLVEPFWVLLVLTVSRALGDAGRGRYQSEHPVTRDAVDSLLAGYRSFLEQDARHQLWIASSQTPASQLILDQRNRIFAYGPIGRYREVCEAVGLRAGDVIMPPGIGRNYHPQFDDAERRLVSASDLSWAWTKTALQPMDDD